MLSAVIKVGYKATFCEMSRSCTFKSRKKEYQNKRYSDREMID